MVLIVMLLVTEMMRHLPHEFSEDSPQSQGLLELYFERVFFILSSDPSIRVRRVAMTLLQLIWVSDNASSILRHS